MLGLRVGPGVPGSEPRSRRAVSSWRPLQSHGDRHPAPGGPRSDSETEPAGLTQSRADSGRRGLAESRPASRTPSPAGPVEALTRDTCHLSPGPRPADSERLLASGPRPGRLGGGKRANKSQLEVKFGEQCRLWFPSAAATGARYQHLLWSRSVSEPALFESPNSC